MNGGRVVGGGRAVFAAVALTIALAACSADDAGPSVADGASAGSTPASAPVAGSGGPTTTDDMRPVPTVPPSTIPGQVTTIGGTVEDGVVDASPTIAPAPVGHTAATTSVVAPTTELVGDPQPNPDTTATPPPPPPPTVADDPVACDRLTEFDVAGVIADAAGVTTTGEAIGRDVCRYASGSFAVEVHFVPVAAVRDDWFVRDGIEPVGEVGSDAVGFASFLAPGSPAGPGYTIVAEGSSLGVIVAVTGTGDARTVTGQVAIFANQAA